MLREFRQSRWDHFVEEDCRALVRLAVREDLERQQDWTTVATVPRERRGAANIVLREPGVVAGIPALAVVVDEMQAQIRIRTQVTDGAQVPARTPLARLEGNVRDLLTCERTLLNLLGRLLGVATLTRAYVDAIRDTHARIYDTRKTTPGWRRLEKYAVRCGGGSNHRTGLYDAMLVKDNHIAQSGSDSREAAEAVGRVRKFIEEYRGAEALADLIVEVEVDSLEQLAAVLPTSPDLVLLDNMSHTELREAVALRDAHAPEVELEASGSVRLETVKEIAITGVDRISVGALTHSARSLDVGLDWCRD